MDDRDSILNPSLADPEDEPYLDTPDPRKDFADALKLNANRYNNSSMSPPTTPAGFAPPRSPSCNLAQETERGPVPKKRGGQPGNLNALKHGLYLDGRRIKSVNPVEMVELFDVAHLIQRVKNYMIFTYDSGINTRDLREINETMRALSLAAMSLTRLVDMYRQYNAITLPDNVELNDRSNIATLIKQYNKKLEPYLKLTQQDSPREEE